MLSANIMYGPPINQADITTIHPRFLGSSMDYLNLKYGKYNPPVAAFGGANDKPSQGGALAVGVGFIVALFLLNKVL